jgi:hypothetical protein
MADISILDKAAASVPKAYKIAGAQEIVLKGVTASFDGGGAGGNWIPAVQVIDPSGFVVGTYTIGSTLAAGVSADVSWFPGVGSNTGASGSGIQFNTDNEGGYLDITTHATDPGGLGMRIQDLSGGGTDIFSDGGMTVEDTSANGLVLNEAGSGGIFVRDQGDGGSTWLEAGVGGWEVNDSGGGGVKIQSTGTVTATAAGNATVQSSGGDAQVIANNTALLESNSGNVNVLAASGGISEICNFPVIIGAIGGVTEAVIQNRVFTNGNYFMISDNTPIEQLRLTPQGTIVLQINDKTGAAIFQVRDDGSLHGKTGKSLIFDL